MNPSLAPHSAPRVLLVDDSRVHQTMAIGLLAPRGFDITVASNGREALKALSQQSFDVVLMDLEMPVMDGLSTAKAIRQRNDEKGRIPIIALTSANAQSECAQAGMNAFLPKPLDPDALDIILNRLASNTAA